MKISSRELNTNLVQGIPLDQYPHSASKPSTPGGPGSSWRMMKLQRVYETAEEEGKPVEEVALERYGSFEAFEEAKEERRILDEREGKRSTKGKSRDVRDRREGEDDKRGREQRWMFTDIGGSGASSRSQSFRRPGENQSTPSTPSPVPLADKRLGSLRAPPKGSPLSMSHSPIPSVMTPPSLSRAGTSGNSSGKKPMSTEELNRMQARVLRAKLMGDPNAETLEKEYENEVRRAAGGTPDGEEQGEEAGRREHVEMLPTLDARGRLYDIGAGDSSSQPAAPGNRRKKAEKFETRDSKTGDLIRYNADDDSITLGEMLRQERFGAGPADQKDLDVEMASAIAQDGGFVNNLDYMDDNAERLGRKKMKSDAMKRQFAINGKKSTILSKPHLFLITSTLFV